MVLITSSSNRRGSRNADRGRRSLRRHTLGGQVIEVARALLKQQTEDQGRRFWVSSSNAGRICGQGRLRLILDGDSDICVAVISTRKWQTSSSVCPSPPAAAPRRSVKRC